MIRLEGWGWRHAGRKAWAVRGVDLRIDPGERVLLLGPSGAGKSTLLHGLAGLLPEDSGESEGVLRVQGRAGVVFQDPQSQLVMSRSGDEVSFGLENIGYPADRLWPRVDEVLAQVGFLYGRERPTAELSGGEQQRLVLAGALAPRPDLLLLDEPTANLDPVGADLMVQALQAADTTLVLIEHRIATVLPLITRVVVLDAGGGIRADGPVSLLAGELGDELAEQGVWCRPAVGPGRGGAPGSPVVQTRDLRVRGLAFPNLTLAAGEVIGLVGPNGSGKSTLTLALGGLLPPTHGEITTPWPGEPSRWKPRDLAKRIGSVFQNPEHQFVTSTVQDELLLGGASRSTVDDLLARLRLAHLARANPFTLSGGEARRLSVATALAHAPRVLLLDEPTFGQDRRTWTELVGLLAELRAGGSCVLAATHDPDFVAQLADREVSL